MPEPEITLPNRLIDRLTPWFQDSVDRLAMGDRVTWDISMTLTPQGPMLMIVVMIPGLILGSLSSSVALSPLGATDSPEAVDEVIRQVLEQARTERSKQAVQSNGHGHAPARS